MTPERYKELDAMIKDLGIGDEPGDDNLFECILMIMDASFTENLRGLIERAEIIKSAAGSLEVSLEEIEEWHNEGLRQSEANESDALDVHSDHQ